MIGITARTTPLTQVVSAATEIGVIYSITYKAIHQVLPHLATYRQELHPDNFATQILLDKITTTP